MLTPFDTGIIHFIGIGGIGMSGIAEVLIEQGFQVSGSDISQNANVVRLQKLGCAVTIGHKSKNIKHAKVVVISTAISSDNPELKAARKVHLPIVKRAEMLAELMRLKWSIAVAGSHGKTTTTSLIAHILSAADYDPTVINGGIINAYNTNIRLGSGDWFVAEADESDGSFLKLPATIAVVTNMDPEHMEHYGDVETLRSAFLSFVEKVPFYGFAVMCLDHSEVQAMVSEVRDRRVITYGFSAQAIIRGHSVRVGDEGMIFDVDISDGAGEGGVSTIKGLALKMYGEHNILNALAAVAVGYGLGVESDCMREALMDFGGVKRRFTHVDSVGGIRIIDDYAHHPVEISAALRGARQAVGGGRILAVLQPHRYSRLHDLFADFCSCANDADYVLVSDVYSAGESAIEGISGESLVSSLRLSGHRCVEYLPSGDDIIGDLAERIQAWAVDGDMVLFMGAGSITQWANGLPERLRALRGES